MEKVKKVNGVSYYIDTDDSVIKILEKARENGTRLRLFLGDKNTGEDWLESYDIIGKIGTSMGPVKIPLLIKNKNSLGGTAILTNCIVRITEDKHEVYAHPKYHLPALHVRNNPENSDSDHDYSVCSHGRIIYMCSTRKQAENYVLFYEGKKNRM